MELVVFLVPGHPDINCPPKGGSRGNKIWPPTFSHTMSPDQSDYAKKSILTRKLHGTWFSEQVDLHYGAPPNFDKGFAITGSGYKINIDGHTG